MQSQVIICDQQTLYALGCGTIINEHPQYNGYRIIRNLTMLDEIMSEDHPSYDYPKVLVLDSGMLNFANPATYKTIQHLKNSVPIMVLFNDEDEVHLYHLIDHGFSVIVSRHISELEWVKALTMAQQDKVYFCATIADKVFALMNQMEKIKQIADYYGLTSVDCAALGKICKTSGILGFFVKDAMAYCGLESTFERKVRSEQNDKERISIMKDNIDSTV
jgi:DNA-binding NarL/FixJ family response regulator